MTRWSPQTVSWSLGRGPEAPAALPNRTWSLPAHAFVRLRYPTEIRALYGMTVDDPLDRFNRLRHVWDEPSRRLPPTAERLAAPSCAAPLALRQILPQAGESNSASGILLRSTVERGSRGSGGISMQVRAPDLARETEIA